jgi:hypothetical protein
MQDRGGKGEAEQEKDAVGSGELWICVLVEARLLGSVGFTLQHWAVGFRYKCAVLGPGIGGRLPEFGGAYSP